MKKLLEVMNATVLIAGLGYFVDLFDISLFGVYRVPSLQAIGITDPKAILESGVYVYNISLLGMMLGGILWGMLADKIGRISVLFASILIYSLANIASAHIWSLQSYALIRFIASVGLAGELGAAVTLVAESLPIEKRGLGTTVVATMGLCGSIAAGLVGQFLTWKAAYTLGGVLGLCLLVARLRLHESNMFHQLKESNTKRGDLKLFFNRRRIFKYLCCIFAGAPVYFVSAILFTFSPEIAKSLGIENISAANTILYGSIGLALGDLASGILSQFLKSRLKAIAACLVIGLGFSLLYLSTPSTSPFFVYTICFLAGLCAGYWAVLITLSAEQFGTNLRGTVSTTIPNFVRGTGVLTVSAFSILKNYMTAPNAAIFIAITLFGLALLALYFLEETFSKNLDFIEK